MQKCNNHKLAIELSKYALLFVIIGLSLLSYGQRIPHYNIENITTEIYQLEKGITQNSVRCILEDRKGYLWFGTWDGLNRYDGTEFKYFIPSLGKPDSSLVQQTINCILQVANDDIWVGTDGGLSRINYNDFRISNYHLKRDHNSDTIHCLFQDQQKLIWIGTQRGIAIYNPSNDSILSLGSFFSHADSLQSKVVNKIIQIGNFIWVATDKGLYSVLVDSSHELQINRINGLKSPGINTIINIKDSILLIGTNEGLNILHFADYSVYDYKLKDKNGVKSSDITAIMQGEENQIWLGTLGQGLIIFDLETKKFTALKMDIENKGHQNAEVEFDPYIYSLYRSRSGIIWVGTAWNGVMKINEKQNIFKAFKRNKNQNKGLIDNHIWSFASNEHSIFIGTESGVNIYNFMEHRFSYLSTKNGLSSNQIRSIYIDSIGSYWIGTFQGGLNYYNPKTHENIIYSTAGDSSHYLNDNTVWTILEDYNNQLWFGTYNGLYCLDKSTGKIRSYFSDKEDSSSLINNTVYCSSLDQNGHIWFGTYEGISEYNPATNRFTSYQHISGDSNSLSVNRIFSIYDDQQGNLWIGTVGGGLNRFHKKTKTFKWYSTNDGLPNNVIYASIPDDKGNLWLSTNYGICRFNVQDKSVISYDVNDGLLSNELNKGAAMRDANGNIYFGGMFGFNVFNPKQIIQNKTIPKIVITSLLAHDELPHYDVETGYTMDLAFHQNSFSIRFAVLDFTNPQKNKYKYRLIGYDQDWISTTSSHPIGVYSRVPPGRYEFQVMGSNNDGVWNPEPVSISIIVRPPWFRRPLFVIAFIVFLVIVIVLLIRGRINHIKNKHEIERQMFEMERQALRLQMNPHFIFNTLNSIQAFILKNKTTESIAYLSKFSRLMRAILNNSQESIISFEQELTMIRAYLELEQLRFEHRFDFEITVESAIDIEFLGLPPMLIQPYIENAVIHGVGPLKEQRGLIKIDFSLEGNYLICEIVDNGVGRAFHKHKKMISATSHKSTGMKLTESRLKLLDQSSSNKTHLEVVDIVDQEGNPSGTKVILFIMYEEI